MSATPFNLLPPEERFARLAATRALEGEITTLAGHLNATLARFIELLGRFDEEQGWVGEGVKSFAHWLSWKCGIGVVAAREKVRVARALRSLPRLTEAFGKGEVSYSKVRAMTRVATPENEEYLLVIARHGTASHMEALVRGYRQVIAAHEDRAEAGSHYEKRTVECYAEPSGMVCIRGRLPPAEGMVVKAALERVCEALQQEERALADPTENPIDSPVEGDTGAELAHASAEAEPRDDRGALAEELPEGSPGEPGRDGAHHDASAEARHVHPVEDYERKSQRRADALARIAEQALRQPGTVGIAAAERVELTVHVDAPVLSRQAEGGRCDLSTPAGQSEISLPVETARRLGCDASRITVWEDRGSGEPLSVGRKRRTIPPAIRRALQARDVGCCFPGCHRARHVEAHHVRHWAEGGETGLHNLVSLCRFHHRLVHEGGYGVRATERGFEFTHPLGDVLDPAPSATGDWEVPLRHNEARGLHIGPTTITPAWCGERFDRSTAVEALQRRDNRLPPWAD